MEMEEKTGKSSVRERERVREREKDVHMNWACLGLVILTIITMTLKTILLLRLIYPSQPGRIIVIPNDDAIFEAQLMLEMKERDCYEVGDFSSSISLPTQGVEADNLRTFTTQNKHFTDDDRVLTGGTDAGEEYIISKVAKIGNSPLT